MREIIYRYNNSGIYLTADSTSFAGETHLKLIARPHDFSIAVGGEVLRSTSFDGCTAIVSRDGEVIFDDREGNELGRADKSERQFEQVRLEWKQGLVSVLFGRMETVDYYPNCDGESDRWGTEWVTQRAVTLNTKKRSVEIA